MLTWQERSIYQKLLPYQLDSEFLILALSYLKNLLNIIILIAHKHPRNNQLQQPREWSKKHALVEGSVQQGRSLFDARSVLSVRERGKMARTPLAAFSTIPLTPIALRLLPRLNPHQKSREEYDSLSANAGFDWQNQGPWQLMLMTYSPHAQ